MSTVNLEGGGFSPQSPSPRSASETTDTFSRPKRGHLMQVSLYKILQESLPMYYRI